jgi:hypothetical protein
MRNRARGLDVTAGVRTAAAFALVVLAGCGSVPVPEISGSVVDATTIANTTTVAVSMVAVPAVVRWVDRPAPSYAPPPEPVVTFPTDARPCQIADLEVRVEPGGAGFGNTFIQVLLTNRSTTPCVLDGYPTIAGVSANGDVTELSATHDTALGDPGPPSNIAPGEVAALTLDTVAACKTDPRQSMVFPMLRLGLPAGDTFDVSGENIDVFCGLWISRFGVPARTPPPSPPIESPLTVSVAMPPSVHPGEQLRYTVTITNPWNAPYPLDPCPTYTQGVASSVGDYYLNCDAVSVIDVGQSVTFEMRIALAADLPVGEVTKFGWSLHVPGGASAGGGVKIDA